MATPGRPRDEVWKEVDVGDDGKLTCRRCRKRFKGGVARIKAHLGNEKGKGISLCKPGNVPVNEGVPEAVNGMNPLEVARRAHNIIDNNIPDSSNHQNVTHPIFSSEGLSHVEDVVGSGNGGFESEINELQGLADQLSYGEDEIKEDDIPWLEYRGKKRQRDDWLEGAGDLKKRAPEMIDSLRQGTLTDPGEAVNDLTFDMFEKLLEKPRKSDDVDGYFKRMEELLRDANILFIGVHGMGGVGKTWLVTYFRNQIIGKGFFNFENVFWVTVSQDFSIFRLQNCIAKRIGIKLDDDDDDEIFERAEILSSALEKKDRSVLILDDVWNYIDLQKVGIPLRANGIKLILTSRLEHVFQQMDCPEDNIIQMEIVDDVGSGELFLLNLGCHGMPAALPSEVKNIATSVVKECDGLPLGISVMARTMKGVNDIHQWRHTLNKLENSVMGEEMEEEVIKVLKLSYDHLDKNIQNCFLQCALYNRISPRKFIMNLVDEGLIKATGSLEELFDEGRTIVDKLRGHSLLRIVRGEDVDEDDEYVLDGYYLEMQGLVRDMANHIVKDRYLVKCSKGLKKIPNMHEWTPDLEKVSLMDDNIEEIPAGTSPRCPKLSTLILSHNEFSEMPDCFLNSMNALTVLDLSYNKKLTSLPNSLSSLRSLKSLLLEECSSLKDVPPLKELQELSRLVISGTLIEQAPPGLAKLVKLRWLDLSRNEKLRSIPGSVIFRLTNMQYLDLRPTCLTVEAENVGGVSKLEYFGGGVQVGRNLADYVENILDRGSGPKYYNLFMGFGSHFRGVEFYGKDRHCVQIGDCEAFDHFLLPGDLHRLRISWNEQWSGSICDALSFKAPSSLRTIDVRYCPNLERLLCLSGSCSFCKHLRNLQYLYLFELERLEHVIWKENDELLNLGYLDIRHCERMEKLLTPLSLGRLRNLKIIRVEHCGSMKEIFAVRSDEDGISDSTITLPPSFKKLVLSYLPQLKFVCKKIMVSKSPLELVVDYCPKLIKGSVRHKLSYFDLEPVILR